MSTMPIKCDGIIGCEWSHEISVFAIFVCRKKDYVQNIPHNHPNHTIPWHCIGIANVTKSTFAHQVWCTNFSVLGKTSVTKMCVWMCQTFTAGQRTLACGYWGCGQQGQQTEYALETSMYYYLSKRKQMFWFLIMFTWLFQHFGLVKQHDCTASELPPSVWQFHHMVAQLWSCRNMQGRDKWLHKRTTI